MPITIKDIIDNLTNIDTELKTQLQLIHAAQWLNEFIKISIWRIKYSYTTARNNHKTHYKYLIAGENEWDIIEPEFNYWLGEFNSKNPERRLSNVKILDTEFLGEFLLEL